MTKKYLGLTFAGLALMIFIGCKTHYVSFRVKTNEALKLYRKAILDPPNSSLLMNMFYSNKKKYSNRCRGVNSPIQIAALDQVTSQLYKLNKVKPLTKNLFEKYFSHNLCCENSDDLVVFVRELLQPQTQYSHFATPFRNKSYVFYIFTDYDPKTGTGKYYQTDAFYPRDAFSLDAKDLCPKSPGDTSKLEFFTGIFYVTYIETIQRQVISLLSPTNDFNDRKVFTININAKGEMTFTKAFEYKIDNYYPIQDGNYAIVQKGILNCKTGNTKTIFETEINELADLKGAKASNSMLKMNYNKQDSTINVPDINKPDSAFDDKGFRDYPYPLKDAGTYTADNGWVFFGIADTMGVITGETFYRFQKRLFADYNREIRTLERLYKYRDNDNYFRPFEVMKMRSVPYPDANHHFLNWDDRTIVGEAYDNVSYKIIEDTLIYHFNKDEGNFENMIWVRIQQAGKK